MQRIPVGLMRGTGSVFFRSVVPEQKYILLERLNEVLILQSFTSFSFCGRITYKCLQIIEWLYPGG